MKPRQTEIPETPERKAALEAFQKANQEVSIWVGNDPVRNRAALLQCAVEQVVETEYVEKLTAWLHWFLENEGAQRDFYNSFEAPEPD